MSDAGRFAKIIGKEMGGLKSGTMRFWGKWFGRPYDNQHIITGCYAEGEALHIRFDNNEHLSVWSPVNLVASKSLFHIADAERVRWDWYYYGRPQTPDNLFFEDFVRGRNGVTNVMWYEPDLKPDYSLPAVEIL